MSVLIPLSEHALARNNALIQCPRFTRGSGDQGAEQCKGMRNLLVRCLALVRCFGAFEVESAMEELNGAGLNGAGLVFIWSLCHV